MQVLLDMHVKREIAVIEGVLNQIKEAALVHRIQDICPRHVFVFYTLFYKFVDEWNESSLTVWFVRPIPKINIEKCASPAAHYLPPLILPYTKTWILASLAPRFLLNTHNLLTLNMVKVSNPTLSVSWSLKLYLFNFFWNFVIFSYFCTSRRHSIHEI